MFIVDAHLGYYIYITQEEFNTVMSATSGSNALTLAKTTTEEVEVLKDIEVSLLQRALDICYNFLQLLKARYGKLIK